MFRFFGGAPKLLVPDNLKSGVTRPRSTIPRSTAPMARWRRIIRSESFRRDLTSRGIRRRSRPESDLRRPTFSGDCAADVLLARRMQRGDRARHATHERAHHAQLGLKPARAVREDRARRPQRPCRPTIGSSRNGGARASISTITSRSMTSSIRFRTRSSAPRSRCGHRAHGRDLPSRPARRRSISAVTWAASTARTPTTCPAPTGVTPSGRRIGSAAGPARLGRTPKGLISAVLASRKHPEQGFRTCLGILRSYRGVDLARVEAVSARAVELGVLNCKGVASLLARKPDRGGGQGRSSRDAVRPRQSARPRLLPLRGNPHARSSHARPIARPRPLRLGKGFKELEHKAEARSLDHAEWLGLFRAGKRR
jgi:hypothetical protein